MHMPFEAHKLQISPRTKCQSYKRLLLITTDLNLAFSS